MNRNIFPIISTTMNTNIISRVVLTSLFFVLITVESLSASFNFSPSNQTFYRECANRVNILIDPDGDASNAADIEIAYNPSQITIIDSNPGQPGTQIGTGDAYDVYFGNEVDTSNGIIRLAGASFMNHLTTQKTFAFIQFQSNPGFGGTANFDIRFEGVGETKDSNIAEGGTSDDLLESVTNGSYSFVLSPFGSCTADTTGPNVTFTNPIPSSTNHSSNSTITFQITDNISGVDLNTLEIFINGTKYISSEPEVTITGSANNYTVVVVPRNPIIENAHNTVIVNASDLAGNSSSRQMVFNAPPAPTPIPIPIPTAGATMTPCPSIPSTRECEVCEICPECTLEQIISEVGTTGVEREICQDRLIETITEVTVKDSTTVSRYISSGIALATLLSNLSMLATPGLFLNAFGFLLGRKHKTPWGIVMDATTRKPIQYAICRLFVGGTTNQIDQTISDNNGIYGFVVSPGDYRLEVTKSGYLDKEIKFTIDEGSYGYVQDIMLEEKSLKVHSSKANTVRAELWEGIKSIFEKLLKIIFIVGFIAAVIAMAIDPIITNILIVFGYTLISAIAILSHLDLKEKYSSVIDYTSSLRIPNALIKIFDIKSGVLVDTKLTNSSGYFDYWDKPGNFALYASAKGYAFPSEIQSEYEKIQIKGVPMLKVNLKKGRNKLKILVDPIEGNHK
jgi:hypothetical protein